MLGLKVSILVKDPWWTLTTEVCHDANSVVTGGSDTSDDILKRRKAWEKENSAATTCDDHTSDRCIFITVTS